VGVMEKEMNNPIKKEREELIENPAEELKEDSIEEPTKNSIEKLIEEPIEEFKEESVNELVEKPKEEIVEKSIKKQKKIVIGMTIFLCILFIIYFAISKYYMNYFYFGTEINGINVSGKTVEDAKEVMTSNLQAYTLNIKSIDGKIEKITADEVGLKYSSDDEFNKFKDTQNPYKWILAYFNKDNSKVTIGFSYDDKQLREW